MKRRHYAGEIDERYVYVSDGKGSILRLRRCARVRGCRKWAGHICCHVL